jgi:hypothetical protein
VPRLRIDRGDHPFGCDPSGDLPCPVATFRIGFDVLASDEGQQGDERLLVLVERELLESFEDGEGIVDQRGDQLVPSRRVVPCAGGLAA